MSIFTFGRQRMVAGVLAFYVASFACYALAADWSWGTPSPSGSTTGSGATIGCGGMTDKSNTGFTVQLFYKDSNTFVVQSGSGTSATLSWTKDLSPPSPPGSWSTIGSKNPARLHLVPFQGTAPTDINITFM